MCVEIGTMFACICNCKEMLISGELKPVIKGSVRSVSGFNVAEVLESLSKLLLAHGGHAAAGGFTLDINHLTEFVDAFASKAEEVLGPEPLERTRAADVQVELSDLDFRLVQEIHSLAPFGRGNPSPVLVTKGVSITSVTSLSKGHLRLRIQDGESVVNAVAWGFQGHPLLRKGKRVNLAYSPDINTYKGMSSVQLDIKEVWSE